MLVYHAGSQQENEKHVAEVAAAILVASGQGLMEFRIPIQMTKNISALPISMIMVASIP